MIKRPRNRHELILRNAAESLLGRDDLTHEEREQLDGALHALDACEHHDSLLIVPVEYFQLLDEAEQVVAPMWQRHTNVALHRRRWQT